MFFLFMIIFNSLVFCQYNWYNHSDLNWHTIETKHFLIHFHDETERSARETAVIAEKIYPHLTSLYDYVPSNKTAIIISDYNDKSYGGAYYYDNKIHISARPFDYDLRGCHRWLQNVITHEFAHIIQVGAAAKYSRFVPGAYLQLLSYADEKRQDVIYGYPNQIMSYPIPNASVPPWFAEGTAQNMYDNAFFDYWDSIRDMILRDRFINNNVLSLDQINFFGKKGIGNESVYNQGFSIVKYIINNYGYSKLSNITKELSKPFGYSINRAVENSIGITAYDLYDNWEKSLSDIYEKQVDNIIDLKNYTVIESEGTTNINPKWSNDGSKIAFLSNKDNDYFGQTDLFIYSFADSTSEKIASGIKTAPTWINDSLIVYSKVSEANMRGSKWYNLYSYDFIKEEEEKLTEDLRLNSPIYDERNQKIYAVNSFDGTSNILVSDETFSSFTKITDYNDGIQIFSLELMGDLLIYDAVVHHGRDLYYYNLKTNEYGIYKDNEWDERTPSFHNNMFITSNDQNGIYNLYLKDNNESGYITNVLGGAFMPDISLDNKIVFSLYENGKYTIATLNSIEVIENQVGYTKNLPRSDFDGIYMFENNEYYGHPESMNINTGTDLSSYKYVSKMPGPFIIPRLTYDYNTLKPGVYFYDNEYLDKMSILGGLSINKEKDIDLFLLFDYNGFKISNFFNFYWITRHISKTHPVLFKTNDGIDESYYVVDSQYYDVDYKYELFSADIGNRFIIKDHKFWFKYTYSKYRQTTYLKLVQLSEFNGLNQSVAEGKYSNDYFRSHVISLEYTYDAKRKDFLGSMLPRSGFDIDASISYEKNRLFEGFKANDEYGGIIEDLKPHNTLRVKLDFSKYWEINIGDKNFISIAQKIKYYGLSDRKVDDFLYFFGGGLNGIKGYTFYEPTLQGSRFYIFSNSVSIPLFTEKNYKLGWFYLNTVSLSFTHQMGKAEDGSIMLYSGHFIDEKLEDELLQNNSNETIKRHLQLNRNFDALDIDNLIPNELEDYIYPDIYYNYDVMNQLSSDCYSLDDITEEFTLLCDYYSIKDLKERYNDIKQSMGIEFRLLGFSFYSFPTALTYEYHVPISDPWHKKGQQYLKILFDFN